MERLLELLNENREQQELVISEQINMSAWDSSQGHIDTFLRTWAERKSQNSVIRELFKDSLRIEVPTATLDQGALGQVNMSSMVHFSREDPSVSRFITIMSVVFNINGEEFCKSFLDIQLDTRAVFNKEFFINCVEASSNLKSLRSLSHKREILSYLAALEEMINTKEEKTYCKKPEEKLYRYIGRLIKQLEPFLDKQELFNEKKQYEKVLQLVSRFKQNFANSKLFLSINPADFFTLSDNNEDWSSCVSALDGSMRSSLSGRALAPDTVIAYIIRENDEDNRYRVGYRYFGEEDNERERVTWNSKLWRSTFVISEDFLGIGRGYPFRSSEFDNLILEFLKERLNINYVDGGYFNIDSYSGTTDSFHRLTREGYEIPSRRSPVLTYSARAFLFDNGEFAEEYEEDAFYSWQAGPCCQNCGERYNEEDVETIVIRTVVCQGCHNDLEATPCSCDVHDSEIEVEFESYRACPNCGCNLDD